MVFVRRRKVIFVHCCFWHGHENCRLARTPKSNLAILNREGGAKQGARPTRYTDTVRAWLDGPSDLGVSDARSRSTQKPSIGLPRPAAREITRYM
ncbi:hypothetical protein HCX48_13085 [Rhodocyclus tenuis]|uniref:Very short patch repair endonuclease n=1 Tax=Rhodocyclus gracilis TaxID=2929842 RepID=A0ABX0WK92_9RHOO|nr:hypothetical protein [Rhodocyclus gracilis]